MHCLAFKIYLSVCHLFHGHDHVRPTLLVTKICQKYVIPAHFHDFRSIFSIVSDVALNDIMSMMMLEFHLELISGAYECL